MRRIILGVIAASQLAAAGCTTVSVYETAKVADVEILARQSKLKQASRDFCETSQQAGWADGDASFALIGKLLSKTSRPEDEYWDKLTADHPTTTGIVSQISTDAMSATKDINTINMLVESMLANTSAPPEKTDVSELERALIHARQAGKAFEHAMEQAAKRTDGNLTDVAALDRFDAALARMGRLADDLADARMNPAMSALSGGQLASS